MGKSKTYELAIKIAGQINPSFARAMATASNQTNSLGKNLKTAGKVAAGVTLAAATAVGTLGVAAIKSAASYEEQLANISTLLSGTEAEVAARTSGIGKQILDVSNVTGVAAGDLTDGMYQVISAFGDSADATGILQTAAKAAAAGNATTTDSINLLSAVTKGYGDTSAEAVQKAADLSFVTVRLGQTSFPELASSMGKVIPLAGTMGVEQEQLFGAMSTLTGVTGSTSEVVTQLKATMQGFLSPSKGMTEALKSMGYESGQALLESKGLQGSLDVLKGSVGGNDLAFAGMFSSVEAQTAVLSLAGTQAENFTSKTAEMYAATGAADTAFSRQTDTLSYTIEVIKNLGANFLTQMGTNMLPYVKDFAEVALPMVSEALENIGNFFSGTVVPAVQWLIEHIDVIEALALGIGTAVLAFKGYNAVMAIYKLVTAASATGTFTLAGAITALNLPLLAVMVGIAAVVAIGVLLYKNWDTIKAKAAQLWQAIKEKFASVGQFFAKLWEKIKAPFIAAASWFNNTVIQPIVMIFSPIIRKIGEIFSTLWQIVKALFGVAASWFNNTVVQPVINFFAPIVGVVGGFFVNLWTGITNVFGSVAAWFSEKFSAAWAAITAVFAPVGDFFSGIWETITTQFTSIGTAIGDAVSGAFKAVVNAILTFAENRINGFIKGINTVVGIVNKIPGVSISEITPLTIPKLATGGIATAATLAMVGEGGEPEAILPLSKLAALMDQWNKKPKGGGEGDHPEDAGTGGIAFAPVQHFYGSVNRKDVEEANRTSFEEFKAMYRQLKAEERRKRFSLV